MSLTLRVMHRKGWSQTPKLSESSNVLRVCMEESWLTFRQIWRDLGVREEHILPGNAKDNFWGELDYQIAEIVIY